MDVLCIGEALIDFVSRERGQTLDTATQYTAATGGAPANVAAGVAKLGRSAMMIATVGDDAFGRKIAHDLQAVGVDCRLRVDPDHFTTLAFVKTGAGGDRDFQFSSGAHDYLLPEQIDPADVRATRVLHYGSISFRAEPSRSATQKALDLAREYGVLRSCDPNWRPFLWKNEDAGRAAIHEAVRNADVLKISDADLEFAVPGMGDNYEQGLAALGFTGRLATVTLGRAGTWYKAGELHGIVPSPSVQVVESTGAGDGFLSALLDCLLRVNLDVNSLSGDALRQVMLRACAAGALTTTGYGAIPSLPDTASIDSLLRIMAMGGNNAAS